MLWSPRYSLVRSISAHAEQPSGNGASLAKIGVYLRACGATEPGQCNDIDDQGLSPRMRSNRRRHQPAARPAGSISAHAEQPPGRRWQTAHSRVYLRACGATRSASRIAGAVLGLSPRMRSNLIWLAMAQARWGSISAHAEQPGSRNWRANGTRVYLRACGATSGTLQFLHVSEGLSPRMRSNRRRDYRTTLGIGSISAHAEQPAAPFP